MSEIASAPRNLVVSDTTPLITLAEIDMLDTLQTLYTQLWIPQAVFSEYQAGLPSHPTRTDLSRITWITVHLTPPDAIVPLSLDPGEAEAIALARRSNARLILMDEQRGRAAAKQLGLAVSGSLGVLLEAKIQGIISLVGPYLDQMIAQGRHIGPRLRSQALALAGEQ